MPSDESVATVYGQAPGLPICSGIYGNAADQLEANTEYHAKLNAW